MSGCQDLKVSGPVQVRVAAVGAGTASVLKTAGLKVDYVPPKVIHICFCGKNVP